MKNYIFAVTVFSLTFIRQLTRDKTGLFFTFLFPLIFLFVFGGLFNREDAPTFNVVLVDNSQTDFSESFTEQLRENEIFEIEDAESFDEAEETLERGEASVIVELPEDFGQLNEFNQPSGSVVMHYSQGDDQLAQTFGGVMQSILDGVNYQLIGVEPPLALEQRTIEEERISQFDFMFSGLLGFAVLSLGIFGLANTLPMYKKNGVLRRLKSTPLKTSQLILSVAVQYLAVGLISIALMLVVGIFVFDFSVQGDYISFLVFSILSVLSMIGFGLAIAGWAKNEIQASPVASILAFPMMFLSGVFFPRFLMPEWLQVISDYLPLTPVVDGFRFILSEGQHIFALGSQLFILVVWTVVIYVFAIKIFRWE